MQEDIYFDIADEFREERISEIINFKKQIEIHTDALISKLNGVEI